MLNFDRNIIGEIWELPVKRLDYLKRMTRPVKKVRITECDVKRARINLSPDVFQNHVPLNDTKLTFINRNYRTVPTQMLATATSFRIADGVAYSITQA